MSKKCKSKFFYSYKLTKTKYLLIYNYAERLRQVRNIISEYFYDNCRMRLIQNRLSKFNFIKESYSIRTKLPFWIDGINYTEQLKSVYTMYKVYLKRIIKGKTFNRTTIFSRCIKYFIYAYHGNKNDLITFLKLKNTKFYQECLAYINKFNDRLFNLVELIQRNIFNKIKLIQFKSLSFTGINLLSNGKCILEESKHKGNYNSVINFNLPNEGHHNNKLIIIPTKFNENYHKTYELNHKFTKKDNQSRITYTCSFVPTQSDKYRLKFTFTYFIEEQNKLKITFDENEVLGVDINTKHNLFACSDGHIINYNEDIIEEEKRLIGYINRVQHNKIFKWKSSRTFGKKPMKRIQRMSRRTYGYIRYKAKELINYCIENNYKHLVIEDLSIQVKTSYRKKDVNYNNINKILHINSLKHILALMGPKYNIMVSFVNPAYTSQTCSNCGYINTKNRKIQEKFKCIKCGFKLNADINAAINIKRRITNKSYREALEYFDKEVQGFRGRKILLKARYDSVYSKS